MNKPLCVIQAPVFSRSGYGDWSREVAKSVLRYGKYDLKIATTKWGNNPIKFKPIGKYNIGMTAGIETTAAAGEWIEGLNKMDMNVVTSRHSKKVFDDADYTKEFQDGSGRKEQLRSTKPMEVCFWGANTDIYKITDQKVDSVEKVMSTIPEQYAFLFVGQWTHDHPFFDRKDIGNLIKTFLNAFKDRPNKPCLILKTSGTNYSKMDKDAILKKIFQS